MRKMKDSGVEWIGQIPSDWDVSKIKYLIKSPLQYGANESGIDYDEQLPRYIRITDITMDNELKEDGKLSLDNTTAKPYLLKDEDILFARSGASVGKTFFYRKRFGASAFAGYLIRASLNKKVAYPKFVFYNTLGLNYENWKNQSFSQATIQNIGADKYNEYILPIPPITEQQRIADFLDEKCGEIDSIRSDVQREIDILNDYKKSVITEAVTKGLDPKSKMKDSGIEWIGKIPEGWDVKRFKYIADALYKGNGITKEQVFLDGNTQCVRYGEIYSKYNISFSDCLSLTKCELISSPQYFEHGDILFAGTGELVEEIGKNIVYLGNEKCLAGGDIVVARHSQNPSFLNYALGSSYCQSQKSSGKAKLKVVHISATQIGNILVAVPPLPEQKAIADYLDEKCSEIDVTIADKQKQLETLDEYKKSLIFEYVTGKKEVS